MAEINLADELDKILTQYTDEVMEVTREVLEEVGKDAVKDLKKTSPRRRGKYAKSWTSQNEKSPTGYSVTIYDKKRYYLTQLLEKGHAKRGGGRVDAIKHISTANDEAQEKAVKKIIERIQRI